MKKLIEKTKNMYKKSFTLIELIAVIVVIGILAAIVIPNISSFKEEASVTAMVADGRNLQTAVDLYQLDHNGDFPTIKDEDSTKPILGLPQGVDFNSLYPAYIRDLPQAKNIYYWIDYQGQFYYSTIDNPNNFVQGDSGLTWTANEKATGYTLYEVESKTTGSSKKVTLKEINELSGETNSFIPDNYSQEKQYFINVVDEYGNEAPPVKSGYKGSLPFNQGTSPTTPEQEELINNPANKMVATGTKHTLIIDENGDLWSFGWNLYGQLGHDKNLGTEIPYSIPEKVMSNVKSVSAGNHHTLALKENGELWSFGLNSSGQLGHSNGSGSVVKTHVAELVMSNINSIHASYNNSFAIKENGELWSFGSNTYGQRGHSINSNLPEKIMSDVKSVSGGMKHTLVVKQNGELIGFGINYYGQLGQTENLRTDNINTEHKVILTGVKSVYAGIQHSIALMENGELWSFGHNQYGQLGRRTVAGTTTANAIAQKVMDNVKSVSAGHYHTLVVKENGELWSFGQNNRGQLGHAINHSTNLMNPDAEKIMDNVRSVAAGDKYSFAVKENDELWSFGDNSFGQLGHLINFGTNIANYSPTEIFLPTE